jgi:hypothetical protein
MEYYLRSVLIKRADRDLSLAACADCKILGYQVYRANSPTVEELDDPYRLRKVFTRRSRMRMRACMGVFLPSGSELEVQSVAFSVSRPHGVYHAINCRKRCTVEKDTMRLREFCGRVPLH